VPQLATMLHAEGAARILITSDDPDRFDGVTFPDGVEVWDRSRFDEAQRLLATVKGTTILIHDQACAAEKRRARSRGRMPTPGFRVVINERICEGCGDCGDVSNCLSVQPIDTPYGRKTAIHQTSCNFDFSCMRGDCPAFATVTVTDGTPIDRAAPATPEPASLPDPTPIVDADTMTVRLSGIGGTGVITVSQIIGTAALFDGFHVRGLDQTGLSQKAGPVSSDIRLSRHDVPATNHADNTGVDAYLAFDLLAAASDKHLAGGVAGRTVVIGSVDVVPTGSMVVDPNHVSHPEQETLRRRLDEVSRPDANRYIDAAAITRGLFGATTTANILVLGAAVQLGAIPISAASLERAIELNGVAVEQNLGAFRFGRRWILDPDAVEAAAGIQAPRVETLDQLVERLTADLTDYQDAAYARRFRERVERVRLAEQAAAAGSERLTVAVARNLHKLMAYKDEYEVARLALLDESQARYRVVGGDHTKVTYHLHPPALRSIGLDRKMKFGRTGEPSFRALRALKRLRGTRLDPFGYAKIRRLERAMVPEYERAVDTLVELLTADRLADAVAIAELPDQVRGYEHLKLDRAVDLPPRAGRPPRPVRLTRHHIGDPVARCSTVQHGDARCRLGRRVSVCLHRESIIRHSRSTASASSSSPRTMSTSSRRGSPSACR
jgi:indolepyruvate ferredoxin oxidoreductase